MGSNDGGSGHATRWLAVRRVTGRRTPAKVVFLLTGLAALLPYFAVTAQAQAGALDTTFGLGGVVSTTVSNFGDGANDLILQPDGKLVTAAACGVGGATDDDFCLVRYHANGALDLGFGSGGVVTTDISGGIDSANALVLQPDGKLVAAGSCFDGGVSYDFCLARYDTNGVLDATFGSGGVVTTVGTFFSGVSDLVLQPDGKLVAAGTCHENNSDADFCLTRYNADGTIDAGFGGGGTTIIQFDDEDDVLRALVLQPDGKLVAAGICGVFGQMEVEFCLARVDASGDLDSTFGVVGRVMTDIAAGSDRAIALVRQPDGKLVAAGGCDTNQKIDFCLARYDANGTLDSTFSADGKVISDISGIDDHDGVSDLVVQPDGKLVAAGFCDDPINIGFCLARYDANGNLDATFGVGGRANADVNPGFDEQAFALALQPDGKLVAAGSGDTSGATAIFLARYQGDPATAIQDLINHIMGDASIPDGLAGLLHQTISKLTDNNSHNDAAACGQLGAFINQVSARERNRSLTTAQAVELRHSAEGLTGSLGCR